MDDLKTSSGTRPPFNATLFPVLCKEPNHYAILIATMFGVFLHLIPFHHEFLVILQVGESLPGFMSDAKAIDMVKNEIPSPFILICLRQAFQKKCSL